MFLLPRYCPVPTPGERLDSVDDEDLTVTMVSSLGTKYDRIRSTSSRLPHGLLRRSMIKLL